MTSSPLHIRPTPLQTALGACRGSFLLVFVYSCGFNLLLLAPSIYLLQVYDRVLSSRSVDTLIMLTLIVAVAVLVSGVIDVIRRAALSRIAGWLDDRLRPTVLLAALEYGYLVGPSQANEAYRDLGTLCQFIESSLAALLFDLFWAPLFLIVLFMVHPLVGGIGLACALLLLVFAIAGEVATRFPLARAAGAQARSYNLLWQALTGIHVIRTMGMTAGAARLIYRDAEEAKAAMTLANRRTEKIQAFAKPLRALSQVLIMGTAAWLVLEERRSPGIIFASSLLFGRALAPVEGFASGWKVFSATREAYRRLNTVLAAVGPVLNARRTALPEPEGRLWVGNVTFCPPGRAALLLKGISLRLSPGECLGLIGPSGSGKSLLGRLIAGLSAPTAGCITMDCVDVATWRQSCGRHLGYLPQEIELFGGSVSEAISRLANADRTEVIRAARMVGMHEAIMRLPQAYDTDMREAAPTLLLSQRQRLGIARACFGSPRLIVLDEPNANLDHRGEQMLFQAIETLKAGGSTIVVITHRMGILPVTDKIAILEAGSLTAFGRSQDIFERYLSRPRIHATPQPRPAGPMEREPAPLARGHGEEGPVPS